MPLLRMIALDLDGTLLDPSRRLSEGSIEAMQEAQEAGITVCMASGRSLSTIKPFQEEAGITGPIVSCNGAYVVDEKGEEIVSRTLDAEMAEHLLNLSETRGILCNIYIKSRIHLTRMSEYAEEYFRRTGLPPEAIVGPLSPDERPTKMLFMSDVPTIQGLQEELKPLLDPNRVHMVRSEADYLEFLPGGVSKGQGLAQLAAQRGISAKETAALGDYWNDLEMLEWAGFSGAMEGAPEEIKARATLVAPSNSRGGAADFIRKAVAFSLRV